MTSTVTIHCGTWSETIQSDDKYFKTLISSYTESTGEVPSDLYFDSWHWLPEQWEVWKELRRSLEDDYEGRPLYYADIEAIAGAMLDLPPAWEVLTILDERVSREKRLQLYKSNGEGEKITLGSARSSISYLVSSLPLYSSMTSVGKSHTALLSGFRWNAEMLAEARAQPDWQAVIWSDLQEVYDDFLEPLMTSMAFDSREVTIRNALLTYRYLITGRVSLVDGRIYSPTTLSLPSSDFNRVKLYKLNIQSYLATEGMAWTHLRIGPDPLLTSVGEDVKVDGYAISLHYKITQEAQARLMSLTNLNPSSAEGGTMWGRITAILLLCVVGRRMAKSILEMSSRRGLHHKAFKCGLVEVLQHHQDDEDLPLEMTSPIMAGMYTSEVGSMLKQYEGASQ